ncbi:hypothetical protein [Paenibacillus sp. DMB5]|uniref:hypothetical protein n=1 Tax=Paenibacillus sp. DMB5 TaxID=1780103 RepID=UPI00076CB74E|nr:hypothetical protein [Paenibacillus sp. DMB5]KUP20389.1 hypothetical protein AWJ19_16575 [Paenibacillus sp. DMB5]
MNEELSRVKSRRKSAERKSRPPAGVNSKTKAVQTSTEAHSGQVTKPSAGLSRKARYAARGAEKEEKQHRTAAEEEAETPSRSQSYPSQRVRWSKIFVNTLSALFILLLAFLVWWGVEGAPELRTLW